VVGELLDESSPGKGGSCGAPDWRRLQELAAFAKFANSKIGKRILLFDISRLIKSFILE